MIKANISYRRLVDASSVLYAKSVRIWEAIRRIVSFSVADDLIAPKRSLCISIEKGRTGMARGTRFFSKLRIKGIREVLYTEGDYPPPEAVASAAGIFINETKAAKDEVTLCIPREWIIFQIADFPITVKESLPDVVSFELDRLTPLSPENAYYDFRTAGEDSERLNISLSVASADHVNRYISALKNKGISVSSLTSEIPAVSALLSRTFKKSNYIYLSVRETSYEGFLIAGRTIISSFSGTVDTARDISIADAVIAEINRLTASLRAKGKGVDFIFSAHGLQSIDIEQRTSLPVKYPDSIKKAPALPDSQGEIPFMALGGLTESLLPTQEVTDMICKGKRQTEKTPYLVSVVLVALLAAIGIVHLVMPLQLDGLRLREIERQIAGMKDEVNKVEGLIKERDRLDDEISTINDFKEDNPMTLSILKELTTVLPKSSWLTRVRITDKTVDLEGYASSSPADLLSKLEASKLLQKVEFASPTVKDMRMNADRFVFKMEIEDADNDEEIKKTDEAAKK